MANSIAADTTEWLTPSCLREPRCRGLSHAEGSNLLARLESLELRPCSSLVLFPVSGSVQLYGKEICAWFVLGLVCTD